MVRLVRGGFLALALVAASQSVNAQDANTWFQAGTMYDMGQGTEQNHALALEYYLRAGELGHVKAQVTVAEFLTLGTGSAVDYEGAAIWYRRAAEQGDVGAQYHLALAYDAGRGVARDYKEAAAWFRRAATQGDANAQFRLGQLYESGRGVPHDVVRAYAWFSLAAAAMTGEEGKSASASRDLAAKQMTPAQIAQAQDLVSKCRRPGASQCD